VLNGIIIVNDKQDRIWRKTWSILRQYLSRVTEENNKYSSRHSKNPDRESNLELPVLEAGMLTLTSISLMFLRWVQTMSYVELQSLRHTAQPQMIHECIWSGGGKILTGKKRGTWRETCPSATLSTRNPTWTVLGANPGLREEELATNRLSFGTTHDDYWHKLYEHISLPRLVWNICHGRQCNIRCIDQNAQTFVSLLTAATLDNSK
jgi:hypothetical protein